MIKNGSHSTSTILKISKPMILMLISTWVKVTLQQLLLVFFLIKKSKKFKHIKSQLETDDQITKMLHYLDDNKINLFKYL